MLTNQASAHVAVPQARPNPSIKRDALMRAPYVKR